MTKTRLRPLPDHPESDPSWQADLKKAMEAVEAESAIIEQEAARLGISPGALIKRAFAKLDRQ